MVQNLKVTVAYLVILPICTVPILVGTTLPVTRLTTAELE